MRITMTASSGVYAKGITYNVPAPVASCLIAAGHAHKESDKAPEEKLQKVMRPDQMRRRAHG